MKKNDAPTGRVSIRDKLLVKEVEEMHHNLPASCKTDFPVSDHLHHFKLSISPDEGYWQGGTFQFDVHVPQSYNIEPPQVKCETTIWHPNITESGEVCLSLLRSNSIDGLSWAPTRKLKDVVWGLNSLFSDLLNFDDPLNGEAAEQHAKDKDAFQAKAKQYVQKYASR